MQKIFLILIALFLLGGVGFAVKDRFTVTNVPVAIPVSSNDSDQSIGYSIVAVPNLTCGCPAAPSVQLPDQNVITTQAGNYCTTSTHENQAICRGVCDFVGTLANGKKLHVAAACSWS